VNTAHTNLAITHMHAMAVDPSERLCTVVLHDDRVSQDDVLCSTDILPEGKVGILRAKNAMPIHVLSTKQAATSREISLHVTLGERFQYENRMSATLTIVNDIHDATANHVEFFFRDICLSRADMWQMTRSMDGGIIYRDQEIKFLGSDTAIAAQFISMDKNPTRHSFDSPSRSLSFEAEAQGLCCSYKCPGRCSSAGLMAT
jgi:hypothetical protein